MTNPRKIHPRRRTRNAAVMVGVLGLVAAVNYPTAAEGVSYALDAYETSRDEYKEANGSWETISFPDGVEVNAVHSVVLRTGQVLIIAGSGNDRDRFEAGTFTSMLWDPTTQEIEKVDTPEDLFCGGHAFLPDGNVLIAGGTREYEVLEDEVTRAAGEITLRNESPNDEPFVVRAGTHVVGENDKTYEITDDVTVAPATKTVDGPRATVTASEVKVWAQAVEEGKGSVVERGGKYEVAGLTAERVGQVYAVADQFVMGKQNYRGLDASYVFDVSTKEYRPTGKLNHSRWYPTLTSLNSGDVMALSGLDEFGDVLEGENEVFETGEEKWYEHPELNRYFPTYPGMHRLEDGSLFYSGTTSGYGDAEEARTPGRWDLTDNSFAEAEGIRDPDMLEYASSVLLPPAQDQRVMVVGGGAVGESDDSTARMDVVDLKEEDPSFTPAGDLRATRRYPNLVTLPDDTVMVTGGSVEYRGRHLSDVLQTDIYDPATGRLTPAADPSVGRNYHSNAVLLPSGQVLVMGSDPLFADAESKVPGSFEQRVEIYSPPYLFQGGRPEPLTGPDAIDRGATVEFASASAQDVVKARLVRPSAATHQVDPEQRSVAVDVAAAGDGRVALTMPQDEGVLPMGWYMLFALDADGVPSEATWVQVR